jgi:hypothetical protein
LARIAFNIMMRGDRKNLSSAMIAVDLAEQRCGLFADQVKHHDM